MDKRWMLAHELGHEALHRDIAKGEGLKSLCFLI